MDQIKKQLIRTAIVNFNNYVSQTVDKPLRQTLGFRPESLENFFKKIQKLIAYVDQDKEVPESFRPLLKTALIVHRLAVAEDVFKKASLTFSGEVRATLENKLLDLTTLFDEEWFESTALTNEFELTNFVSIQHAIKLSPHKKFAERKYDEKFHILNAPELFSDDLFYYRFQCGIRNTNICVAYIDIDKFKNFNSKYGESRVDKEILPRFMSEIDAYLYPRGFAYRYGGDEYIVTIPNMLPSEAVKYFAKLQEKIGDLSFYEITDRIEVSIGVVLVTKDTFYTNHEIEGRAAYAKNFAKENGRNCIAINL